MKPVAVQTLRSRWFAACVHLGLWVLLYLGLMHLGGSAPKLRDVEVFSPPPETPAPIAKLDALLSPNIWPHLASASAGAANPFVTHYFAPTPVVPPPPPTTRKIDLTYLGYSETDGHPKQAFVRLFDSYLVSPLGARVASNLYVAQLTMQTMTLTNPSAKTNILTVNKKQEIEVPLR